MKNSFFVLTLSLILSSIAFAAPVTVSFKDAKGQVVGKGLLTEDANGVKVAVEFAGAQPGLHGMHIHASGLCEGPKFESAGGHFNPTTKKHGKKNPEGSHLGDLPNLEVDKAGNGKKEAMLVHVTLNEKGPNSLATATGSSLIIHAKADDEKTDPSGNSGDRMYCAVIHPATVAAAPTAPAKK